jgi:Ca-activated chloride channel homolog
MTAALQFTLPGALLGLITVPVFLWAYLRAEKQRWQAGFHLSALATEKTIRQTPAWQRVLWPITASLLLTLLWLGLAGPVWQTRVATRQASMMLVLDISLSMLAQDMAPNRLTVATQTASRFVTSLPRDVRVGLLLFAGNSVVVTPPITDHDKVGRFLTALKPEDLKPRTEIGTALQAAQQALLLDATPPANLVDPVADPKAEKPLILLLSDGDSREGYPWDDAAREAKAKGLRIDTVAVGRPEPTTIVWQGQVLPVAFNPDTLRQVAELGGGRFFQAFSAQDFTTIYEQLARGSLHLQSQAVSLTPWLCAAALVLLMAQLWVWLRHPWAKPV